MYRGAVRRATALPPVLHLLRPAARRELRCGPDIEGRERRDRGEGRGDSRRGHRVELVVAAGPRCHGNPPAAAESRATQKRGSEPRAAVTQRTAWRCTASCQGASVAHPGPDTRGSVRSGNRHCYSRPEIKATAIPGQKSRPLERILSRLSRSCRLSGSTGQGQPALPERTGPTRTHRHGIGDGIGAG